MKKIVYSLLVMLFVFGLSNVLAEEAVKIGNPGLVQFPNNDTKSCLARSVWDLHNYNGKIYVGTGDLGYMYNQGPINVWSFDAQGNFTNEFTVDDEQIIIFRSYDNKLFIPGSDAMESWEFGNLYVKDNGVWEKFRTIPNGIHIWDMAMFDGKFYVISRTERSIDLLESSDFENWTWVGDLTWIRNSYVMETVPLDDFLLITAYTYEWEPGIYKYFRNGEMERAVVHLPQGIEWINFARIIPYKDGVLFIGNYKWTELNVPAPLLFLNDFVNANPKVIKEFKEKNVRDIVVRGNDVYVLTASVEDGNFEGAIYSSSDLEKWNILAEFSVPALPYSLELLDGSFYVGLGNRYYGDGYADVESGSIYKIGISYCKNGVCYPELLCDPSADWKSHGKFVSCVAKKAEELLEQGLITEEEKDAIVSEAAKSDVGKPSNSGKKK